MNMDTKNNIQADISNNLHKFSKFIEEKKIIEREIIPNYKDFYVLYNEKEGFACLDVISKKTSCPHIMFDIVEKSIDKQMVIINFEDMKKINSELFKKLGFLPITVKEAWSMDFNNRCTNYLGSSHAFIAGNA